MNLSKIISNHCHHCNTSRQSLTLLLLSSTTWWSPRCTEAQSSEKLFSHRQTVTPATTEVLACVVLQHSQSESERALLHGCVTARVWHARHTSFDGASKPEWWKRWAIPAMSVCLLRWLSKCLVCFSCDQFGQSSTRPVTRSLTLGYAHCKRWGVTTDLKEPHFTVAETHTASGDVR